MFATDSQFEDEVRRVSRLLWPLAEFGGAKIDEGRERDGVFETEEFVHLVECTVSRSKAKAEEDCQKLGKMIRRLTARHPTKFIKGWFITLHEPTADQRAVVAKEQARIVALSFDQFRARLVDARSYLTQRKEYPFGSVRDPESGQTDYQLDYLPLDMLDPSGESYTVEELAEKLLKAGRFVLLGDYGAGKSATLRELFLQLSRDFWSNKSLRFPVMLNLRDHHGQTNAMEALERHARNVGFGHPSHIVRAWRAGYVTLLLDGFDEIASAGWAGRTKTLRDLRFRSMELVRHFIRESPTGTGIILAGRAHFFDNPHEMQASMGFGGRFIQLTISEFSNEQVGEYLRGLGWKRAVPEWLPSRPLLLAYLASRNLLRETLEVDADVGPAAGWHMLLDRISAREAEIEAGIDPDTVRRLIEYVATLARTSIDGLGPLGPDTITEAFKAVCGYAPDDRGAVLLQRLPGLGGYQAEDGSRVLVDRDFADAARSGIVYAFIGSPYTLSFPVEGWETTLSPLGADIAAYRCELANYNPGRVLTAMTNAYDKLRAHTLCTDLFLVLQRLRVSYEGPQLQLREVLVPELTLDEPRCSFDRIQFHDCVFGLLETAPDLGEEFFPSFIRSHFGFVVGRAGERDLPSSRFIGCSFGSFESSAHTTNAILELSVPLGTKVVLTILKKLYAQSGSGRRESALYRGLDVRAQQLVPDALNLLRREGLASRSKQGNQIVWLPTRTGDSRKRALAMLAAPNTSKDQLLAESRNLG
jgi:hypothetical protein